MYPSGFKLVAHLRVYYFHPFMLLCPEGQHGVYLNSNEHGKSYDVQSDHKHHHHRCELTVDLIVAPQVGDVEAQDDTG